MEVREFWITHPILHRQASKRGFEKMQAEWSDIKFALINGSEGIEDDVWVCDVCNGRIVIRTILIDDSGEQEEMIVPVPIDGSYALCEKCFLERDVLAWTDRVCACEGCEEGRRLDEERVSTG